MRQQAAAQQKTVHEDDLLKAIDDLHSAVEKGGSGGPIPKGYMGSTSQARGGSVEVLEGGPGSTEGLKPSGHDDAAHFDMGSGVGEAAASQGGGSGGKGSVTKAGYKRGEEDDEDESDDDDEAEKSMRKSVRGNDDLRKGLEVSPFLEALTDTLSDSQDGLAKAIYRNMEQSKRLSGQMAKAMVEMGNRVVQLTEQYEHLMDSPRQVRKSALSKADIVDRDFQKGEGDDHVGDEGGPEINKSMVETLLCDWVEKGELAPVIVTEFEATNRLPDNVASRVKEHFSAIG